MLSVTNGVNAMDIKMYVNDIFLVRNLETVGELDMLPILDIAGELGFQCTFDGTTAILYNDLQSYSFTLGNPTVIDRYGNRYGLDAVPQIMKDRFCAPAKFFQDAMGLSYTWDDVTNTIFISSDATYQWLIGTPEYKRDKAVKKTWDFIQGWWLYYDYDEYMSHFSENICFYPDGTFYYRTWRTKGYGTYRVVAPETIMVNYDVYFIGPADDYGPNGYTYCDSCSATYQVVGYTLMDSYTSNYFNRVSGYCYPAGDQ